jgi:hypothetical protein
VVSRGYITKDNVIEKLMTDELIIQSYVYSDKSSKYWKISEPITVNFTVDNGFNNWWVLWYWLNVINNSTAGGYNANMVSPGPNAFANKTTTYQTNITVYGLDEYNNKKIQFNYLHAFITNLGEISYSYRDGEQIESTFTFEFGQLDVELL